MSRTSYPPSSELSFFGLDFIKDIYSEGALIGLHLVESFLYLTTSADTACTKIILAVPGAAYTDATILLKDNLQI